jgi:hypothetical protein
VKKSDMLSLLKQDIEDAAGDLDLQARMVLSRVLSCGMLPPPNGVEAVTATIVYSYYDGRVIHDENGQPIVSELWESE